MSWKPEVKVIGEERTWHCNALVFETEAEAFEWAEGLFYRWALTTAYRAVEVDSVLNPPNYKMVNGQSVELERQ